MANIAITLKDTVTGEYVGIPVIPEAIEYQDGDSLPISVKIIGVGDVEIPDGVALDAISWASFFPSYYDPGYCAFENFKDPLEYRNLFSSWKDNKTHLQLVIPVLGINKLMYLKAFTPTYKGADGEIFYSLTLTELKILKPVKINITAATAAASKTAVGTLTSKALPKKKQKAARTPVPKKAVKSYTAKKTDTILTVAKKLNTDWRTVQTKNPKIATSVLNNQANYGGKVFVG